MNDYDKLFEALEQLAGGKQEDEYTLTDLMDKCQATSNQMRRMIKRWERDGKVEVRKSKSLYVRFLVDPDTLLIPPVRPNPGDLKLIDIADRKDWSYTKAARMMGKLEEAGAVRMYLAVTDTGVTKYCQILDIEKAKNILTR